MLTRPIVTDRFLRAMNVGSKKSLPRTSMFDSHLNPAGFAEVQVGIGRKCEGILERDAKKFYAKYDPSTYDLGNPYDIDLPDPTEAVQFRYVDPNIDLVALDSVVAATVSQTQPPVVFSVPDIRTWWDSLDTMRRGFITFREFMFSVKQHDTLNSVFTHLLYRVMPRTQKAAMAMHWATVDCDRDSVALPFVPERTGLAPQDAYKNWYFSEPHENHRARRVSVSKPSGDGVAATEDGKQPPHQKRKGRPSVASRHAAQTRRLLRLCEMDVETAWDLLAGEEVLSPSSAGRTRTSSKNQISASKLAREERAQKIELAAIIQQFSRLLDALDMEHDGVVQWPEFISFFRKYGLVSEAMTIEAKWHILTAKARAVKVDQFSSISLRGETTLDLQKETEVEYYRRVVCRDPMPRQRFVRDEDAALGIQEDEGSLLDTTLSAVVEDDVPEDDGVSEGESIGDLDLEWRPSRPTSARPASARPSSARPGGRPTSARPSSAKPGAHSRPTTATTARPSTASTGRPTTAGSQRSEVVRSRLWWREANPAPTSQREQRPLSAPGSRSKREAIRMYGREKRAPPSSNSVA